MTNEYYVKPSDLAPGTKARSVDINALTASVAAAFDKVPNSMAMKTGTLNYAVDTGTTANAYVVALDSAITSYTDGLVVRMRPTRANTGACSINVNGLGAVAIKRSDGGDMLPNDIGTNLPVNLSYVAATGTFTSTVLVTSQVQAAATQAQNATAAAASASGYASAASTSASAAAGSATAASGSASAAANSASAAQAAVAQATVNQIQADVDVTDTASKAFIKNKASILNIVLAGLNTAQNVAVSAADGILSAIGKLQAQVTGLGTSKANKATTLGGYGITDAVPVTGVSFTGAIGVPFGSMGAPSIRVGDSDTGIYAGSDGAWGLTCNGQQTWGFNQNASYTYRSLNIDTSNQGAGYTSASIINTSGMQIRLGGSGPNGDKYLRLLNGTLDIVNNAGNAVLWQLFDSGDMSIAGTMSANVLTQRSDENKKEDWQRVAPGFVDQLAAIDKTGTYRWKDSGALACGIGAQSLEAILPSAVYTDADGAKQVNTGGAAMVMCAELARELVALRTELQQLKAGN